LGRALVGDCVALAAASLILPWALAFDAEAWLVWGRQVLHGSLDTAGGPSWKPLPVLIAAPLTATGATAAPVLWLLVARAGALLALAGAWALALRLGAGRTVAGAAAAGVLALSPWWLLNGALGNSEGLLAASVLWAAVMAADGRLRAAWWCGVAAGLLRPEIWPFLALAGWRLWRTERGSVLAGTALTAVLWFGPDVAGTGGALGASAAARGPASAQSAANAAVPGPQVLLDAAAMVTLPALAAAIWAVARPVGPPRLVRAVAGAALAYVGLVAVATQAGYAGNPRYLVPAAALGAALAGAGVAGAPARRQPLLAGILVGAVALLQFGDLRADLRNVGRRAALRADLDALLERAGGPARVKACGPVRTTSEKRTLVARRLTLPVAGLQRPAQAPVSLLRARPNAGGPLAPPAPPGLPVSVRVGGWELRQACRRPGAPVR
jgi:hypothetical protein